MAVKNKCIVLLWKLGQIKLHMFKFKDEYIYLYSIFKEQREGGRQRVDSYCF